MNLIQDGIKTRYFNVTNQRDVTEIGTLQFYRDNIVSGFSNDNYLTFPTWDTSSESTRRDCYIVICFYIPEEAGVTQGTLLSSNGTKRILITIDNNGSNNFLRVSMGSGSSFNIANNATNSGSGTSTMWLTNGIKYYVRVVITGSQGSSYRMECSTEPTFSNCTRMLLYNQASGTRWNFQASQIGKDGTGGGNSPLAQCLIFLNECSYSLPNEGTWQGGSTNITEVTSSDTYTDTINYPIIKCPANKLGDVQ